MLSRLRPLAPVAVIVFCISTLSVGPALAIRYGTATNDLPKTVMAFAALESWGQTPGSTQMSYKSGTVTNVWNPRCFLTARTILRKGDSTDISYLSGAYVIQGEAPFIPSLGWPSHSPLTGVTSTGTKLQELERSAIDFNHNLAVLWVKNELQPTAQQSPKTFRYARMAEPVDYAPITYGGSLGVGTITDDAYSHTLANGHQDVDIIGYGTVTGTVIAYNPPVVEWYDTDSKHKGIAHARNLYTGTQWWERHYNVYEGTGGVLGCNADIGGPLFKRNDATNTYAVMREQFGFNGSCKEAFASKYIAIDDTASGSDTIKKWVDRKTTIECGKPLGFIPQGQGKIMGALQGYRYIYADDSEVNGSIACNDYVCSGGSCSTVLDCEEMLHGDESIAVEAIPSTGYTFDHWEAATGYPCPCVGQDATCAYTYDDAGYYAAGVSIDDTRCIAVFTP